jgi:Immunity protein 50
VSIADESIEQFVESAERLGAFYSGAWPCLHDAEIVELHLWRGQAYPGDWDDRNVFPILTLKILILEATQPGAIGTGNDVIATLRFHDVDQVRFQDFNHNNSIVGFAVTEQPRGHYANGDPLPPSLLVTIEQGFGLFGSFNCARMEVLTAEHATAGPLGAARK